MASLLATSAADNNNQTQHIMTTALPVTAITQLAAPPHEPPPDKLSPPAGGPPLKQFKVVFSDGTFVVMHGRCYIEACIHAVSYQIDHRNSALIIEIMDMDSDFRIVADLYFELKVAELPTRVRWMDRFIYVGFGLLIGWFLWELTRYILRSTGVL